MNVDNLLYWTGVAPADSYEIALAADLEAAWTSFANGLDMNSLKAACKVRQLVVQTSEGHGTKRPGKARDWRNGSCTCWVGSAVPGRTIEENKFSDLLPKCFVFWQIRLMN